MVQGSCLHSVAMPLQQVNENLLVPYDVEEGGEVVDEVTGEVAGPTEGLPRPGLTRC